MHYLKALLRKENNFSLVSFLGQRKEGARAELQAAGAVLKQLQGRGTGCGQRTGADTGQCGVPSSAGCQQSQVQPRVSAAAGSAVGTWCPPGRLHSERCRSHRARMEPL